MTIVPRIYLDTSAFIFAVEEMSDRSDLINALFDACANLAAPRLVTSELTLAEVLVKPYRDANDTLIQSYEDLLRHSPALVVQPVVRRTLKYAAFLRTRNRMKLPDAVHLSTAVGSRCTHLLTADDGLRRCRPANHLGLGMANSARITMSAPDIPTLTTLLESLSP
ncbi:putative nucleic acid-binding protein [Rhizobium sp. PP-F2F-G20b]|nr:putative nucleic acid-binding protein [Rhizobium sp. PP-F2F-G20b]